MLITDKFVFIHLPKTGGMFVDGAIKEALVPSWVGRKLHSLHSRLSIRIPGVKYRYFGSSLHRHASCASIPEWASRRPLVGVIRSPYDWYVSDFRFGLWRQERSIGKWWVPESQEELRSQLPNWPELSFLEYVHAANLLTHRATGYSNFDLTQSIGLLTKEFLRCYCRDRPVVYDGDDDGLVNRTREHLYPVTFLHQSNLNDELVEFLGSLGYSENVLAQIQNRQRIYPGKATRPAGEAWQEYYDDELRAFVRHRERVIFSLFPEFDI